MIDPEKVAADVVGQYADNYNAPYLPKLTAEVATALRAARNEAWEEAAKIADELFGLSHHPLLISGALQAAAAIRSMKDTGNG